MPREVARTFLILLFAIWAGVTIGVSFLATPAKFLAPSLSMPVALDVGRQTFRILVTAELGMATSVFILCWFARADFVAAFGSTALWTVLLAQRFWLLPLLDARVSVYLSGLTPSPSYHHSLYIALEAFKVIVLLVCAAKSLAGHRASANAR
jgi:hypothetical protein